MARDVGRSRRVCMQYPAVCLGWDGCWS